MESMLFRTHAEPGPIHAHEKGVFAIDKEMTTGATTFLFVLGSVPERRS